MLLPFSGRIPNTCLSLSEGFYWDGEPVFPGPPTDGLYPSMEMPVTENSIPSFTSLLLGNVLARVTWFRTPHVLWPWVSWGPRPWFSTLCMDCSHVSDLSTWVHPWTVCPVLIRSVSIQAVGHPSPGSVLLPCTPSPHPVYQLRPPPWITPTTSPPMHPLPDAGSSLSPALLSFPLLNDGSRGLGLNPGSQVRGFETWDPLGLTFLICEMGMMTGPAPLAGFEVKWE